MAFEIKLYARRNFIEFSKNKDEIIMSLDKVEATREVPYLPVQYSQHLLTIGDSKYHCTTP